MRICNVCGEQIDATTYTAAINVRLGETRNLAVAMRIDGLTDVCYQCMHRATSAAADAATAALQTRYRIEATVVHDG